MASARKVRILTLGCRLNQAESAMLAQLFIDAGYVVAAEAEKAELCVLNTCTLTAGADAKCRTAIRRLIRENPDAVVAVVGCYAQSGAEALAKIQGVDLVVGTENKMELPRLLPDGKLDKALVVAGPIKSGPFSLPSGGQTTDRCRANLKIQDGCGGACAYCIVPLVRGRPRSREFGNLLSEAKALRESGFREIVLTGVNLGAYSNEGMKLIDVVDSLDALGFDRVRISSVEPTNLDTGIFKRMADGHHALVPFLHIPLQSGSDRVLGKMGRKYTRNEFIEIIRRAAAEVPGLCIGTDLLLGTPWESEEDFQDTMSLVADEPIAYVHAFTYSERKGTAAALEPQLPPAVRKLRTVEARRIGKLKRREFFGRHLGAVMPVLFETLERGLWQGHTENYIMVKVKADKDLRNRIENARLESVSGESVLGKPA